MCPHFSVQSASPLGVYAGGPLIKVADEMTLGCRWKPASIRGPSAEIERNQINFESSEQRLVRILNLP